MRRSNVDLADWGQKNKATEYHLGQLKGEIFLRTGVRQP